MYFMYCFCHVFGISQIKKKKYQRNRSALKHALVNSNKESIMKSRIIRLSQFKVGFNITNSWNHKSYITENKVISSLLHALLHGSKTIAPPNPKTNPNPNPNQGAIYLRDNCLVAPNPKTNPNFDRKSSPNRGTIFLGGQLSGCLIAYHIFAPRKEKIS